MKPMDCDIIQDLLPIYNDKISSISTNKLVEEHLRECENCRIALKNMDKNINTEILNDQSAQIDYLKGYKKRKRIIIISSIILTIIILMIIFIVNVYSKNILIDRQLYVDVNKFNAEYMYLKENEGKNVTTGETYKYKTLEIYLYADEYKDMYLTGGYELKVGEKEIYFKIAGKQLPKDVKYDSSGMDTSFNIDGIEKIYIEDTKHNLKEIWNKDMNVQTEEEWKKWYIDSYVPTEIKKLYNMNYDNIPVHTSIWKHLYNSNFENNIKVKVIKNIK